MDRVEIFDWWSFHDDGSVQYFQIREGEIIEYQEYADVGDAPIAIIDESTFNPRFEGPLVPLSYYGRSYLA